jgi:hypothetical protein
MAHAGRRRPKRAAAVAITVLALALAGCSATRLVSGHATPKAAADTTARTGEPPVALIAPTTVPLAPTATAAQAAASAKAQAAKTPAKLTKSGFDSSAPCARNTKAQLVVVVISLQHAWMCQRTTKVYDTAITTGASAKGDGTPTGTWRIQGKQSPRTLNTRDGGSYHVKYWMPYDGDYGFHDASWQTFSEGSPLWKTQGSHGCEHLPLNAMTYLYSWAKVGATVTVRI